MRPARKEDLPLGVYRSSSTKNRYIAVARHKGVRHYLGSFASAEEASAKYKKFREHYPSSVKKPWQPGDKLNG